MNSSDRRTPEASHGSATEYSTAEYGESKNSSAK
jgi:hypothetical protein